VRAASVINETSSRVSDFATLGSVPVDLAEHVGPRARGLQAFRHLRVAVSNGKRIRRAAVRSRGIDSRAVLQQQFDPFEISGRCCSVQRRLTAFPLLLLLAHGAEPTGPLFFVMHSQPARCRSCRHRKPHAGTR
jgi:hypothetical protein